VIRVLSAVVLVLALAACASESDEKLAGDRVAVLRPAVTLKADPDLAAAPLNIGEPQQRAAWPQPMGAPDGAVGNVAFTRTPSEVWSANIGSRTSRARLLARPVAADGKVFALNDDSDLKAFDLTDGSTLWSQDLRPADADEQIFGGGVAYDNGAVFATTGYGEVLALNTADGAVLWRTAVRNILRAAPLVDGGRVYAMAVNGELYALDASTGAVLWSHNGIAGVSALLGGATPVITGDVVLAAYSSGEVYAIRAQNGKTLWNQSLTSTRRGSSLALNDIKASPVAAGDRVYAISYGGRMAAIDGRTGNPVWDADVGGLFAPVVTDDAVFVLADGSALATLERSTGRAIRITQLRRWLDEEDEKGAITWAGPVLGEGVLWLVNNAEELVGIDAVTGEQVFTDSLPDAANIAPIIADKTLLILTADGALVAYR
jgi:outer membrane protein assembly factor BamB